MFILALIVLLAGSDTTITKENWQMHPAIVEIRRICAEVDSMRLAGRYEEQRKEQLDVCNGSLVLLSDEHKTVRFYARHLGGDVSWADPEIYYDSLGRKRFAIFYTGDLTGTMRNYYFYFDTEGKTLWRDEKSISEHGNPYNNVPSEDWLPKDPVKDYHFHQPCLQR